MLIGHAHKLAKKPKWIKQVVRARSSVITDAGLQKIVPWYITSDYLGTLKLNLFDKMSTFSQQLVNLPSEREISSACTY